MLHYIVHINVTGPESRSPFTFSRRMKFASVPDDCILLQKDNPPREEFILAVEKGGSHPVRPGQDLDAEVITSPHFDETEKIKRFIDFLRQEHWEEKDGHASFDATPPSPPPLE